MHVLRPSTIVCVVAAGADDGIINNGCHEELIQSSAIETSRWAEGKPNKCGKGDANPTLPESSLRKARVQCICNAPQGNAFN